MIVMMITAHASVKSMAADMRLAEKIALITGAGSGIGRATALLFAREGARVVAVDINEQALADTMALMTGPQPGTSIKLDLTDPQQVQAGFKAILASHEKLDILVNVAGGSGRKWGDGPADECSLDGWQKTLDLNLNSLFYCCKYGLQAMLPAKYGVIVTVSSVLGLVGGDADFATHAYAASKGAAISLTRSIAAYYAPHGIRANVIAPGLIATPMSQRAQESQHIRKRLPELQPLGGDFGSPDQVAEAAAYLASDASGFVTGAVLTVDGGWTVR